MVGKLKKIFRMSPGEILFRIGEQIRIRREKAHAQKELHKVLQPEFDFFDPGHPRLFERYRSTAVHELWEKKEFARKLSEPLSSEKKERFLKDYGDEVEKSVRRADLFLEHRFSFLGVSFTLPDPIPWQSDPLTLAPYPQGFYRDIDIFTNKNAGDIKHVWEVNRLQFLIELAKTGWLTGEEKYILKMEEWLLDWIEKNPYKQGVAWASALEVGVRVTALIWTLEFYRATERPKPYVVAALLKLIYLSGTYLYENLSIYFSPYNHLIGEAAGLFLAGYLFPGFRDAQKWEKRAWQVLVDQIEKQFHPDGASVEQASFYHHFTLGFYLQAMAVKGLNGETVPDRMARRVEKALEFSAYITKPDGDMPHLGDIDDARSIYFGDPTHWNFDAWRAIGAVWFDRSDFKHRLERLPEEAFWLLSGADIQKYQRITAGPPGETALWLKESGYAIFRNHFGPDGHYSHMDCGPIAHGVYHDNTPSAAHGHADELAIELACFGESHLIDPGFSNYRGDFNWHSYFRSTAAHNTIEINGRSQAKQGGILVWSRAPRFKQLAFLKDEGVKAFCGEHYGYENEAGSPVHRRYMAFVDDAFWLVIDFIYSARGQTEKVDMAEHLHFAPDKELAIDAENQKITSRGRQSVLEIFFEDTAGEEPAVTLARGGDTPDEGWVSPTYRATTPAPLVKIRQQATLPWQSLKIYMPAGKNGPNPQLLREAAREWRLILENGSYRISQQLSRDNNGGELRVVRERDDLSFTVNVNSGTDKLFQI